VHYRGWDVLLKRRIRLALPVLSRYSTAATTTDTTATDTTAAAATADSGNDSTADSNSSSGWRVVTVTLLRHPRSGAVRIEAVAASDTTTTTITANNSSAAVAVPLQGITAAAAELPAVLQEAGASHLLLPPTRTCKGGYSARCAAAEARSRAVALALIGALRLSPFVQDAVELGALAYHRARSLAERALLQCTSWGLRLGACIRGRGRGGAEVLREVRRLGSRLLLVRVTDDWGGLCIEAIDSNRREVSMSAIVVLLCYCCATRMLVSKSIYCAAFALSTTCKLSCVPGTLTRASCYIHILHCSVSSVSALFE
jgi:hypothetical protein